MDDLHELIYSMNQSIAIQAWEIDPDMETEKFTIAIGNAYLNLTTLYTEQISV